MPENNSDPIPELVSEAGLSFQDANVLGMLEGMLEILIGLHQDIMPFSNPIPSEHKCRVKQLFNILSPKAIAALARAGSSEQEFLDYLIEQVG